MVTILLSEKIISIIINYTQRGFSSLSVVAILVRILYFISNYIIFYALFLILKTDANHFQCGEIESSRVLD